MKKIKCKYVIFGFILAILFAASNVWSAPDERNSPGFAWKDGAEVYAKICAYCHEAQVGPHIRNRDLPAAYIRAVVRNGRFAMPAFRPSEIDDESLIKLADFISNKDAQR